MRQVLSAILTFLVTASFAMALEPQVKTEIDELITFVKSSDVRFIRNGSEHTAAEGADHLRAKLGKAGDRVKTTDDFITGIASKSYLSGKLYMVRFPDGRSQPVGEWLKAHLAEQRKKNP
jgi:hypothetical protein